MESCSERRDRWFMLLFWDPTTFTTDTFDRRHIEGIKYLEVAELYYSFLDLDGCMLVVVKDLESVFPTLL